MIGHYFVLGKHPFHMGRVEAVQILEEADKPLHYHLSNGDTMDLPELNIKSIASTKFGDFANQIADKINNEIDRHQAKMLNILDSFRLRECIIKGSSSKND